MANAQLVSKLDSYTPALINRDVQILVSIGNGESAVSQKMSLGALYDIIKKQISADLAAEWKNHTLLQDANQAMNEAAPLSCYIGSGVIKDLSAVIDLRFNDYQPRWH